MIRTRRLILAALGPAALGLAACNTSVPDSGAGVGFQDYNSYIRSAQPAPAPAQPTVLPLPAAPGPVPGAVIGGAAPAAGFDPAAAAAAIDRADGGLPAAAPVATTAPLPTIASTIAAPVASDPLDPNRPRGNAPSTITPQSGEMAAVGAVVGADPAAAAGHAGISDEQDFAAVSQRETIQSDKERIERNKANYVVVQPGAVPERAADTGPNIVQFALSTSHAPGTAVYTRRNAGRDPTAACARYGSPDLAQQAFLGAGGPDKDKLGIDPDGDGFACDWDPRPFRTALN